MEKKRYSIWELMKKRPKAPKKPKSLNPPTEAQLMQRDKFRVVAKFVKHAKEMTTIGFEACNFKNMTPVNFLTRYILMDAVIGEYPDYQINYPKVQISKGKLGDVIVTKAVFSSEGNIILLWEEFETYLPETWGDDELFVFIYDSEKNQSYSFKNAAKRSDLKIELKLPSNHHIESLHVWIFFKSKEGRNTSWSEYLSLDKED
ncbi:DUF6266 family protein [Pedobacter sp. L105]|uniref:DUF6266 family protein n=1 Tax=Pedobacter sp. L105 TaxID=1641871 RepID=UPI00131D7F7C|nr:DUF6266 family protein [Pedobacter sp. L105]